MVDTGKGKKVPLYQVAQVQSQNDLFIIEVQDTFPNVSIILLFGKLNETSGKELKF